MAKKSKKESLEEIEAFFSNPSKKTSQEIKKILKTAMANNIKLKEKRKLFCRKCFTVFNAKNSEIRIKKGMKAVRCLTCNSIQRWKLKTS